MKLIHMFLLTALIVGNTISSASHAANSVKKPYVTRDTGKLKFKHYGFLNQDGDTRDAYQQKLELGYALNDWWWIEPEVEWQWGPNGLEYMGQDIENIFQLTEADAYWLDYGFLLGYDRATGHRADTASLILIAAKKLPQWNHAFNIIFERGIGAARGGSIDAGFAWQTTYNFNKQLSAGIEYFGEFGSLNGIDAGNNGHKLGPYTSWKPEGTPYQLETGLLFGLTDRSPDAQLKIEFSYLF